MSAQDIFETISSQYFQLTNSEKKVADYVLRHRIDVQYMSISELAEECTVADATISRFCRRLDYKGYNAFKLAIANSTAGRVDAPPPESEITPEDTIEELSQKLYVIDRDAMAQTLDLIAAGKLDTTPLITHTYPLKDIDAAYQLFESRREGVIKVAIQP